MSRLFSEAWMQDFAQAWNGDDSITNILVQVDFNATIGYGFKGNAAPVGILVVEQGKVSRAALYQTEKLDWDLRANEEDWRDWLENGMGMDRFGFMIARKKLQFMQGDIRSVIRAPSMAKAFLRSFELMGKIETDW